MKTGSSMDSSAIPLLDKIMTPGSWFNALFYKPLYILKAMTMAIPWMIKNRFSVTKPRVFDFVKALRTSPPPFPTDDLKIGAAGFWYVVLFLVRISLGQGETRVLWAPPYLSMRFKRVALIRDSFFLAGEANTPCSSPTIRLPRASIVTHRRSIPLLSSHLSIVPSQLTYVLSNLSLFSYIREPQCYPR